MSDKQNIILHNFLHPSLSIRKEGFKNFKQIFSDALKRENSNWKELREYLWKAIENEDKDENHQRDLVMFTLDSLKGQALLKMIRIIENDKLLPKSIKAFSKEYISLISSESNKSIKKSLLRKNSSMTDFIYNLLQQPKIVMISNNELLDLFNCIFLPELEKNTKIHFAKGFMKNKNINTKIEWFVNHFSEDNPINIGILSEISEKLFIWKDKKMESNKYLKLNPLDKYLINSIYSSDKIVRRKTIELMGNFSTYELTINDNKDIIYDFWHFLEKNKLDYSFINLPSHNINSLNTFFNCNSSTTEEKNIGCGKLQEFQTFEISPYLLLNCLIFFHPRKLLIEMTKNDSDYINRALSFKKLNFSSFWIEGENASDNYNLIGLLETWTGMFNQIIISMCHEKELIVIKEASRLLNGLISWFEKLKFDIQKKIISQLNNNPRILLNIELINNNIVNPLPLMKLKEIITGNFDTSLFKNNIESIDIEIQHQIINLLSKNIIKNESLFSIIVNSSNISLKEILIDFLIIQVDMLVWDQNELTLIGKIITEFLKDSNIAIRSKSHLLSKRYNLLKRNDKE